MAEWPTIPAGTGVPLVDTATGEFESELVKTKLSATYVVRGFVDAKADFGVSPDATAAQNTSRLTAAVAAAEAARKPLMLPITGDDWIDVDNTIEIITARVLGWGVGVTRVRSTVAPRPIFRLRGSGEIGSMTFTSTTGNNVSAFWSDAAPVDFRGETMAAEHCAIKVEYPAHHARIHDIDGFALHGIIFTCAWDDDIDAVSTELIEDLRIWNVTGDDTAFVIASRGVTECAYENISGRAVLTTGIGAPPHVVYMTSWPTYRYSENVTLRNIRGWDCARAHVVKLAGIKGGYASGITGRSSRGILEIRNVTDYTISDVVSLDDTSDAAYSNQAPSIYVGEASARTVIRGGTISFNNRDHLGAIILTETTADCEVADLSIIGNRLTDATSENYCMVDLLGTRSRATRLRLDTASTSAQMGSAFRVRNATDVRIVKPRVRGKYRFAFASTTTTSGTMAEYDRSDIALASSATDRRVAIRTGSTEYLWLRESSMPGLTVNALAYDDGRAWGVLDDVSTAGQWASMHDAVSSGSGGSWRRDPAEGHSLYNQSGHSNANQRVLTTASDVAVTTDVRFVGTVDTHAAGVLLRCVDADDDDYLAVDLMLGYVRLRKRAAATMTVLAETAYAVQSGRRYVLKAAIVGNVVTVTVDGVQVLTYTLAGADATLYAGALRHGLHTSSSPGSRFYRVVIERA